MHTEEYNVEIKSEEYYEIVGAIPPIIIRYGIGVLFAVLLFIIVLSNNISYKTFADATVFIEKTDTITSLYNIRFRIKPESFALIKKGLNADIALLQYPTNQFGTLNIKLNPVELKFVTIEGATFYEWTQSVPTLISERDMQFEYVEGLQGTAKIAVGKETITSKITQSIRNSLGINF